MREAERAALSAPTIFEGIAQPAERMRHMHQVGGANPPALTICPCGVVQPTRLPLMQEITGAKPVRDTNPARGSRGITDPPDSESGSLGRAIRLAPTSFMPPKAFAAMRLLGKQASLVQFRVRAPFP